MSRTGNPTVTSTDEKIYNSLTITGTRIAKLGGGGGAGQSVEAAINGYEIPVVCNPLGVPIAGGGFGDPKLQGGGVKGARGCKGGCTGDILLY